MKKPSVNIGKYAMKSVVDKLLPGSRTYKCHKWVIPRYRASIFKMDNNKTYFGGLEHCRNVWICPICSIKISEKRRQELKTAISNAKNNNLSIVMMTLTAPHYKGSSLDYLISKMQEAYTKSFRDTSGKEFLKKFNIIGRIRALEVTYGEENGFHPHFHILLFFKKNQKFTVTEMENNFYSIWENSCLKKGLGKPNFKNGIKIDDAYTGIGNYISKWGIDSEMTKGHLKKSSAGHSMFDLLRLYILTKEDKYIRTWMIFAKAFKGKKQLHWSKGLKNILLPDEQYSIGSRNNLSYMLMEFSHDDWAVIKKYKYEPLILSLAENKNARAKINELLEIVV